MSVLLPAMSKGTFCTTSPIITCVIGQKAMSARMPATHSPL